MTLHDLAARCESATGPSFALERDIYEALGVPLTRPYTANIDAALMLVPKGWAWMAGCDAGETFFATLCPTDESGIEADMIDTNAATPALALCAAALRARAQIEGGTDAPE